MSAVVSGSVSLFCCLFHACEFSCAAVAWCVFLHACALAALATLLACLVGSTHKLSCLAQPTASFLQGARFPVSVFSR